MLYVYNTQYQRVNTEVFLALALDLHSHFTNRQFLVDMLRPTDQFIRPAHISNNRIVILYQMSCEMKEITVHIAVGSVSEILYFIQIIYNLFFLLIHYLGRVVCGAGDGCLIIIHKVKHVL
jgi:hypothetical protein